MIKKSLPTISVVIATFNSQKTIEKCLSSIRTQNYPQKKIEVILADGGSRDDTKNIAKEFSVAFFQIPRDRQNAEYNKGYGVRKAKGDYVLMIDHDNILPHDDWLRKMIFPMMENPDIVASETLRYHYDPRFSILDRYFALFGAAEPIVFYFGKTDRLSFLYDKYNLYGIAKDKGTYYEVQFNESRVPTLGANGFLINRKILMENAMVDAQSFFHIDVNIDLIKKGFNTYAFVKDDIIHLTGYSNIWNFFYRKMLSIKQFYVNKPKQRRYAVFMKGDELKLFKFVFYSITFVKPLIDSIRGYMKIQDLAWFLHPVMCFGTVMVYGYTILASKVSK